MTVNSLEDYKKKYHKIDDIRSVEDIEAYFKKRQPKCVYLNRGINSDSGLDTQIPPVEMFRWVCPDADVDKNFMHDILSEARTVKHE